MDAAGGSAPSSYPFWGLVKDIGTLARPSIFSLLAQNSLQLVGQLFIGHLGPTFLGAAAVGSMACNIRQGRAQSEK